jgi:hypothetical protein
MTQERRAVLYLVKDGKSRVVIDTEAKVREASATIADLKAAGYAKLFDAEKYVKDREEVTCIVPNKEITDATLVSEERSFAYHLYVTEK